MLDIDYPEPVLSWQEYVAQSDVGGQCLPVVFVDHTGVIDTTITARRPYHVSARLGYTSNDNIVSCNDQTVIYSAEVVSPVTGSVTQGVVAVGLDGVLAPACVQTTAALYPYFADIKAIYPVTRGDFLVAANVYDEAHDLNGALYFFSNDGVLATREAYLQNKQIRSVISHAFI